MAAFNYSGLATITWKDGTTTVQYVHYDADDGGEIYVWPVNSKDDDYYEYRGRMFDHPAEMIKFRH